MVEVNCQLTKFDGQENRRVAGGTREMESVGEVASAVQATANAHKERYNGFMAG